MPDFIYRAVAPDAYRISADGVDVGSVSKRVRYAEPGVLALGVGQHAGY